MEAQKLRKLPEVERLTLDQAIERHKAGTLVGVFLMTNEDYHNAPGISKSSLDKVEVSPASYRYSLIHPEPPTDAMETGSALHTAILEREEFEKRYAVAPPELDRRGTKAWCAFEAENPGKTLLKFDQGEEILDIAKAALTHSRAALLEGYRELTFFWKHPATGMLCKVKPDVITAKGVITDYKSCAFSVYPARAWANECFKRRYHVQAAFYLDGVHHALEQSGKLELLPVIPKHFAFFAQEKKGPYLSKPWLMGESSVELGRRTYEANLLTVKECEQSGRWPGYPEKLEPLDLPDYAWKNELDELPEVPNE